MAPLIQNRIPGGQGEFLLDLVSLMPIHPTAFISYSWDDDAH